MTEADETHALALAANAPAVARLAEMRTSAVAGVDAVVSEFIARHNASVDLIAQIENEVALLRRELDAAHSRAHRALDRAFGARALTPAPSPLDGETTP